MAIPSAVVEVPGPQGPPGDPGDPGPKGDPGVGVPSGGTTGQALVKASATDYDTEWGDAVGGNSSADLTFANIVPQAGYYLPVLATGSHNTSFIISSNLANSTASTASTIIEATNSTSVGAVGLYVNTPMDAGGRMVCAVYSVADFSRVLVLPEIPIDSTGFKEVEFTPTALPKGKYLILSTVKEQIGTTNPTFWAITTGFGLAIGTNMTSNNHGFIARWDSSQTYGAGWPSTLPEPFFTGAGSGAVTMLRVSLKVVTA